MSLFSPVVEVTFNDLVDLDETENKISPNDDVDKPLLSPLFSDLDAEDDDPMMPDSNDYSNDVDGIQWPDHHFDTDELISEYLDQNPFPLQAPCLQPDLRFEDPRNTAITQDTPPQFRHVSFSDLPEAPTAFATANRYAIDNKQIDEDSKKFLEEAQISWESKLIQNEIGVWVGGG